MAGFKRENKERQRRLWHEIAQRALRRWDLPPGKLSWLRMNGKAVAKVQTAAGAFVLRLYPPGSVNRAALQSELRWLSFIRRRTDLLAPLALAAEVNGHEHLFVDVSHGAQTVIAVVFQFIEGAIKSARDLTLNDVFAVGEYLGKLHQDAQFEPPPDFERPRLDWEGLFGGSSPYASPGETEVLERGTARDLRRCRRAHARAAVGIGRQTQGDGLDSCRSAGQEYHLPRRCARRAGFRILRSWIFPI